MFLPVAVPKQRLQPAGMPICKAILGPHMARELGWQFCLIWVPSQWTILPLYLARKQIHSPTQLLGIVSSPTHRGSLTREPS